MADPHPLIKTPLAEVQLLTLDGQPLHTRYETLVQSLRARASPEAALLFAQPIAGAAAITWYTESGGEPLNLSELPASRADMARQRLTRALAELEPLLDDPGLGPLLRQALVVPGRRSIWVTDGTVVLSDWGSLAAGAASTPSALAAQLRDVLGGFSPLLGQVDERFFAGAPLSLYRGRASGPGLGAAARPTPPVPGGAMAAPPPPVPPAARGAAAAAAASGPRPLWVLPVVTGVALLFLILGFWLAWVSFARELAGQRLVVPLIDEAATDRAIEAQRSTNAALERELERARQALQAPNICTPTGPLELNPAPSRQPIPPAAVPQPVPPAGGQTAAPPASTLAQLLERATVMVAIEPGGGTFGHGSGFFIAGDTVMTNAHVVEPGAGGRIFITSSTLGRAFPAQVAAMTRGPGGGDVQPGVLDLAVLRLAEPVPGAQPLAWTTQGGSLTDVVAAGYPASVVQQETEMREFILQLGRGQLQRPPELVLSRGTISSVQHISPDFVVVPHSADISPGNSGGPLVDTCGRVVGINTFVTRSSTFADRVKYAQKADSILPWLQQNIVRIETRSDACTPVLPGLPATPGAQGPAPNASGAPGSPPASASPTPPPAASR